MLRPARSRSTASNFCSLIAAGSALFLFGTAGCTTQVQADRAAPGDLVAAGGNSGLQATTLVEKLENPWGLVWLPDGEILITERPGRVRIVREGALEPDPIPGVPTVLAENQGGLMDIALHPRFAENRLVYFTYSHGTLEANRTRIARATFDGGVLQDWEVIFEVAQTKPQGQHFGSRLVWLPDETLLASIGDGGNPPVELAGEFIRQQAQNLGSHLGKVIRINDDGSIPADNPFATEAAPEVWSYGHRNIQGLAYDPDADRIWGTEHGSRGGDELNLLQVGENYGWPLATHSREYTGGIISPERSLPGMVDPEVVWTPAIAPSGLAFYNGDAFPQWQGNLFAGGLVSRDLRRLELDAAGTTVINQESIPIGQRVRDVRQGPDGLLYVLTDSPDDGRLLRLEPSEG